MNTSDRIFKLQGQLSSWSGTKKVACWLAIVAVGVSVAGAIFIGGEERRIGALAAPPPPSSSVFFFAAKLSRKFARLRLNSRCEAEPNQSLQPTRLIALSVRKAS
jgi:hypothetical protein